MSVKYIICKINFTNYIQKQNTKQTSLEIIGDYMLKIKEYVLNMKQNTKQISLEIIGDRK